MHAGCTTVCRQEPSCCTRRRPGKPLEIAFGASAAVAAELASATGCACAVSRISSTTSCRAGFCRDSGDELSPHGTNAATGINARPCRANGGLCVWRLRRAATLSDACDPRASQGDGMSVAFSPDGRTLAAGGFSGTISIWRGIA